MKAKTRTSNQRSLFIPRRNWPVKSKDLRIINRNMIYVIGMSPDFANEQILQEFEYFGQFGELKRVAVTIDKSNHQVSTCASAYVTFNKQLDASLALLSILIMDKPNLKASFGMTKYCSYFLAKMDCQNIDCAYFHGQVNESDCVLKVHLKDRHEPVTQGK